MTKGYTLIELLVVVSILALLMGWAVLNYAEFLKQGDNAATLARIEGLRSDIDHYRTRMGDYPPSRLEVLGVTGGRDTFEGIEAMVVALRHKDYLYGGPGQSWFMNLDADRGDPNVTQFKKPDLFEVVDGWGNPFVYMRYDDYERTQTYAYLNQHAGEDPVVEVEAGISEKTGSLHNARSYQLRSPGADGVLGTEDDITSYE